MSRTLPVVRALPLVLGIAFTATPSWAAPLLVTQTTPPRHALAEPGTAVVVDFDKAVDRASVGPASFRVFGRATGTKSGAFAFSNGDRRVTFEPDEPFSAGEAVRVQLSHDLAATDLTTLRAAGFFFQFKVRATSSGTLVPLDTLSNRIDGVQTRIYGAAATDLNHDRFLDLATVNQVSADVRVCLNRADGSGLYHPFLPPVAIGPDGSPNEPADFDRDGDTDLCVSSRTDDRVWVLRGAGDGTFPVKQSILVGDLPRGIATLDVDGDGDEDIVNANRTSNHLTLLVNDGAGTFALASSFDGGVNGEYALTAGDMNHDGIADLVVASLAGEIGVLLGNGDGTFASAGPAQPCGGPAWVVALDDLDGDGRLDASVANTTSNNNAILLGDGAGRFGPPTLIPVGWHATSTDLGDLDGDGDPDLVVSSFFGGFWRVYRNDGAGAFTFDQDFPAPSSPSCAALYDADNDGDLDLALTDEIADVIVLVRNAGAAGVDPGSSAGLKLLSSAPNPFRDGTEVRFFLERPADVRLDVFDPAGRWIVGGASGPREAGWQSLRFDGRDRSGRRLPAGLYLFRLKAGKVIGSGRMVVAR
jgi:hypothetical protein